MPDGFANEPEDMGPDVGDQHAVDSLISYIIDLYFGTTLNAQHVCIIMHYLSKMGYGEKCSAYELHPQSQSGKFQRKLDKAFGFNLKEQDFFGLDVPMRNSRLGQREVEVLKCCPAHESLFDQVAQNPNLLGEWEKLLDENEHSEWIGSYNKHPKVQAASLAERKRILPGVLYMDGAMFSKKDSLYVFTIRFAFSFMRNLVFSIRKSNLCDCGCHGWCSFFSLFSFVAWSLRSLLEGVMPSMGPDGFPLAGARAKMGGMAMGFCVVICDIVGDWKEFANSFGLPPWNAMLPCFLCNCTREQMRDPRCDVIQRRDEEYSALCATHEVWVPILSRDDQNAIRFNLIDNAKKRGLVLKKDLDTLTVPLFKHDRLEPTQDFPDIHQFFEIESEFKPFTVLFWRALTVNAVWHRSPILSLDLGISYMQFSVDTLHCLHLGFFITFMTKALHLIFQIDGFDNRHTRKDEKMVANAIALKSQLSEWYPMYDKQLALRGRPSATRVNHLTDTMLGSEDLSSLLSLKGAESRHFLPFVLHLLEKHKLKLGTVCRVLNLIRAGVCLEQFMQVLNREPRKMSPTTCQYLVDLIKEHNDCVSRVGLKLYPKHHQALQFCLWKNTSCEKQVWGAEIIIFLVFY